MIIPITINATFILFFILWSTIGVVFGVFLGCIFHYGNREGFKITIPVGIITSWLVWATQVGLIIWK